MNRGVSTGRIGAPLRSYEPAIDFRADAAHTFPVFRTKVEANASVSVANADYAGGMPHTVHDDIAGLTHCSACYNGDAIHHFPTESTFVLHQRLMG